MMHSHSQEAKDHADKLQNEIDDLHSKAQSSSGETKDMYLAKIEELSMKKEQMIAEANSLKNKAGGFMDKLGM